MTLAQPVLAAASNAFDGRASVLAIKAGSTVAQLLAHAVREGVISREQLPLTDVWIDDERLNPHRDAGRMLSLDQVVSLEVTVNGGGGGGGEKSVGQILLQVAVLVVASWVGGPGGAAMGLSVLMRTVAAAAIMAAGQMAAASIFKPAAEAEAKANDRYALQAASNRYRPWGPMPLVLGRAVVAPDLAVKSYTQTLGDEVWLYGILGVHYGPVAVEGIKIGDTSIESMGEGEIRIAYHLTPGPRTWSIYPNTVDQSDFSETLDPDGTTELVRAAGDLGTSFEFDFAFPRGLYFQKDNGKTLEEDVVVQVRYRPINDIGAPLGSWAAAPFPAATDYTGDSLPAGAVYLRNKVKEVWRVTRKLELPEGLYEFGFTRDVPDDAEGGAVDDVLLTAIRAIRFTPPITDETLSVIEFAVRASALNQGTLAPIVMKAEPMCDVWDGDEWGDPEPTSNPAALTRWLVTGPAAAKPLDLAQADVGLGYWFETCVTRDWQVGLVITEARSQADVLQLLGLRGRAAAYWSGRALEASTFTDKIAPRQLFSGRNLRQHTFRIAYPEPVHALRVEFQNLDEDGEPDEVMVYSDGFGPPGPGLDPELDPATRVETFRIEGQCTIARAWRDGRWELAERRNRRRIDSWSADIDHIACRLGDRVRLSWWVIRRGLGHARVRCRRWSGSDVVGVRLDQPVEMEAGKSYAVDLRKAGGLALGVPVQTTPGLVRELVFVTPMSSGAAPAAGDLLAFGEADKVSEDVEVLAIEPQDELTARMVGVRYIGDLLAELDGEPVPEGLTTGLTGARRARPPSPRLVAVQADPNGVRLAFDLPPWAGSPITGIAARWRWTPPDPELGTVQAAAWQDLPMLGAAARVLVTPPVRALPAEGGDDEGETHVDVELVALAANGGASEPLLVTGVLVSETVLPPIIVDTGGVTRVAPDGSTRGVVFVQAQPLEAGAQSDLLVQLRTRDGGGPTGDWKTAGPPLPAAAPEADLLDVASGQTYGLRTRWRDANGWLSPWTDEEVVAVPADSNVASDLTPGSPVLARIDELEDEVADLTADGVLDAREKIAVVGTIDALLAAQSSLSTRSNTLGVTTERTAYNTALNALSAYLATLTTPAVWDDLSGPTDLDGDTFVALLGTALRAETALQDAMDLRSAMWTNQSGRPANLTALAGTEVLNNALVALGQNTVVNSAFESGDYGASLGAGQAITASGVYSAGVNAAGFFGDRNVAWALMTGTPAAFGVFDIAAPPGYASGALSLDYLDRFALPVSVGQRIYAAARIAGYNLVNGAAVVFYWDRAGALVAQGDAGFGVTNGGSAAVNGIPSNFTRAGGFLTVPANAAYATVFARAYASGGANPIAYATELFLARVPNADQTQAPLWSGSGVDRMAGRYLDDLGRVRDGRGLPPAVQTGYGVTFDTNPVLAPGGTPTTQISIPANTARFEGSFTVTWGATSLTGLTADTLYYIFRDVVAATFVSTATLATAAGYRANSLRYLPLGAQRTALTGSSYSPPPPPAPGGGGGRDGAVYP